MSKYTISVHHGEHRSLFYIMKTDPNGEWEVEHTSKSRPEAEKYIQEKEKMGA